jgi:hypothetical protein
MATINYNGMELEEFTSDKPVAFPEGTKAICWDSDKYEEGFRSELDIVAFIPYLKDPVLTRDCLNDYQDSPYRHCAILPDPPKPRRATNRELARWLIEGNAQIQHSDSDMVYVGWNYNEYEDDFPCSNNVLVRKWSDTEWHEPTVDYLGLDDDYYNFNKKYKGE